MSSLLYGFFVTTALSTIPLLYLVSYRYFLLASRTLLIRSTRFADCENASFSSLHFPLYCVSTGSHFWCQLMRSFLYVSLLSTFPFFSILLYHLVVLLSPFGLGFAYLLFVPVPESELPALIRFPLLNFRFFLPELSSRNCYRTRNGYWKNSI